MTPTLAAAPRDLARAWIEIDPDPECRQEIEDLLRGDDDELERRFGSRLSFGTAGLRGPLGAGPNRMSRALVRIVAAAIADRILREGRTDPHLVVGYDARHKSRAFAEDTARVVAGRGVACTLLPRPLPTPVLAFAVGHLDASAGVMVTASHNPRTDNGYKVYWRGGAQIASPIDEEISDLIDATHLLGDDDLAGLDDPLIAVAGSGVTDAYRDAAVGLLDPQGPRTARVAYTPLHGVGRDTLVEAFAAAGFAPPAVVASQAEPDPDFPTAAFPNPEETGVLDPLLELAGAMGADVALANDPDADRLAVAVPNGPAWRLLSGDELGCLLAEHRLRSTDPSSDRLVINTVVSSRLLPRIADHHGAAHATTLTGFKWIMHARQQHPHHSLVLGYEEALGYCVGDVVADKDGISAALVVTEMVSQLADRGQRLTDLLDEIHRRHGVHATGQRSIRFEATDADTPVMETALDTLRARPPVRLAGREVTSISDLSEPGGPLPPTNAVILEVAGGRVVIRPSGTEPKMKVYGEAMLEPSDDLAGDRVEARRFLTMLLGDAIAAVATPERPPEDPVDSPGELEARASELTARLPEGAQRAHDLRLVVRCIDLTTLEGDDTPGRIRALCAQAKRPDPADPTVGPVAAVCVYPALVSLARELLGHGSVEVASVAGAFPSALSDPEVRRSDIAAAVAAGAGEVDIVLNRSAFLGGRPDIALAEIEAGRLAAGERHLKVIIEVGELGTPGAIAAATRLAIAGGADVVKTSTGKTRVNATPAAVLVIAEVIAAHHRHTGRRVGLKVAGGVRSADDALGYVAIVRGVLGDDWLDPSLFRFGASSLLDAVLTDLVATETALG